MRKLIVVLLIASLFTGCAGKEGGTSPQPERPPEAPTAADSNTTSGAAAPTPAVRAVPAPHPPIRTTPFPTLNGEKCDYYKSESSVVSAFPATLDVATQALVVTLVSPLPGDEIVAFCWFAIATTVVIAGQHIQADALILMASDAGPIKWPTIENMVGPQEVLLGGAALAANLEDNWWFSLNHKESAGIVAALSGPTIASRGDNRSNGSIQLWAGVNNGGIATIGGVWVVNSRVAYIAFRTPVQSGPGPGLKRLGESPYYYSPTTVSWTCAWWMSKVIGHEAKSDSEMLTIGAGWTRWEQTKTLYGLTWPVAVLYLSL